MSNITEIGADNVGRVDLISTCDGFTDGAFAQSKEAHEEYLKTCAEKQIQFFKHHIEESSQENVETVSPELQ